MKLFRIKMFCLLIFFGLLSGVFFAYGAVAATAPIPTPAPTTISPQYQQLENIPGYEGNKSFPEYVSSIYKLALWIVGLSAMFMLTVGGFMYLTSAGNTSSASTAKGVIKDALIGLVLGLSAWLIVNTINPDLTTLNVSGIDSGASVPPAATPSSPAESLQQAAGAVASNKLATTGNCKDANGKDVSPASNIAEVKGGHSMTACHNGCDTPNATACTDKVNPAANMLSAINSVNSNYKITSISGGSHKPSSAHYAGTAIDVVPSSANKADWVVIRDEFIAKGAQPNNPNEAGSFCESNAGLFKMDCVGADHIHVRF